MSPGLRLPLPHVLAASLCAGLAAAVAIRLATPVLAVSSVAAAMVALLVERGRLALLAGALLGVGCWWGSVRLDDLDTSALVAQIGSTALARLEVTGAARTGEFTARVPVVVRSFDDQSLDEPAQLVLPASERAPPQGALIDTVAVVRAPREPDAGSSFDEAAYLRRHGIHVVLRAHDYRLVGRRHGLAGLSDRIRATLSRSIAPGLSGERRALVEGIVLGEDEGLDEELRDRFRASGLYHVLAVSGQNVAFVVAGVLLLCWLLGIPRGPAHVFGLLAIVAYVAAVGWQPSVLRAGIAGSLTSLAWLASRPRDRWYFLLVGAALLLAWSPYNLLDPGFQLSFAAVAAIFVVVPRLERVLAGYPIPRPLAAVLAVSTACGLATAPILWLQFGSVPVLSVVSNALGEPVVAPILALGLGAAGVGAIFPDAANVLGWLNGWLVAYLAWCARFVGGLPFARIESWRVLVALLVVGIAVALLARARPWQRRRLAGAVAVMGIAGIVWLAWPPPRPPPPTGLRLSFLDVGQGDAALIEVPEGAVLVDEGPPEAGVAATLKARGIRRLAAIVLTHPERDHVGGASAVLRTIPVDRVLDPRLPVESNDETDALVAAEQRGVPIVTARAGQSYRLGALELRILWPDGPGDEAQNPNDHAVVILATYGRIDALLAADAESNVTARLQLPPVEILKVAHHGSADAGLPGLLDSLRPKIAVISVGAHNDYGHPTASTLAALRRTGLRVYRTDRDGTVVVTSDGTHLKVATER